MHKGPSTGQHVEVVLVEHGPEDVARRVSHRDIAHRPARRRAAPGTVGHGTRNEPTVQDSQLVRVVTEPRLAVRQPPATSQETYGATPSTSVNQVAESSLASKVLILCVLPVRSCGNAQESLVAAHRAARQDRFPAHRTVRLATLISTDSGRFTNPDRAPGLEGGTHAKQRGIPTHRGEVGR